MLIAEMVFLVAITDKGGVAGRKAVVRVGLAGALLAELAIAGHLTTGQGRTLWAGETRPSDELLADVYDAVRGHLDGRTARQDVGAVGHYIGGTWDRVAGRLVSAGVLARHRPLLVLPARHPVLHPAARQAIVDQVRAAAAGAGPLPPDLAVAASIAGRCRLMRRLAPDRVTRRQLLRQLTATPIAVAPGAATAVTDLLDAVSGIARTIDSSHG